MTRILRVRFRLLAVVAALSVGALGLALGTAAAASAGGYPYPSPSPSVLNTYPPPDHHHHDKVKCDFVLLTGSVQTRDAKHDEGYGGPVYSPANVPSGVPSALMPAILHDAQPPADEQRGEEQVDVFQVVKVCEVGEHVFDFDVTQPFAFEEEANQYPPPYEPTMPGPSPSDYVTAPA